MKPRQGKHSREYHYQMEVGDVAVAVVHKPIRRINITVYPPDGRVRVSAPLHVDRETVHQVLLARRLWIERKRQAVRSRPIRAPRTFTSGELHYVAGQRYQLQVIESSARPEVRLRNDNALELRVRPDTATEKRAALLHAWYRTQLQVAIPPLIAKWEPILGVEVAEWRIRRMKTRWGTCNIRARRIWFNLELAERSPACLEYIVVHEMVHLLERRHNARFWGFMDEFLPNWRDLRAQLNQIPG